MTGFCVRSRTFLLEPAVRGRGAEGNCFPLDWLNSEFWIEPSTNIRNIRNLHRQFEIQMLVENHKSRCATFASGFTNDLTPPIGELFGALERSNGPIMFNPPSLALECQEVLDNGQRTDRRTSRTALDSTLWCRPTSVSAPPARKSPCYRFFF